MGTVGLWVSPGFRAPVIRNEWLSINWEEPESHKRHLRSLPYHATGPGVGAGPDSFEGCPHTCPGSFPFSVNYVCSVSQLISRGCFGRKAGLMSRVSLSRDGE